MTAHGNADGLSRLPVPHADDHKSCELSVYNVSQVGYFPVTVPQLQKSARQDPVLSKVLQFMRYGWLTISSQAKLSTVLKPYWLRRSELTTECSCLLWGTRIITPHKLHQMIQEELHIGHPGIIRM